MCRKDGSILHGTKRRVRRPLCGEDLGRDAAGPDCGRHPDPLHGRRFRQRGRQEPRGRRPPGQRRQSERHAQGVRAGHRILRALSRNPDQFRRRRRSPSTCGCRATSSATTAAIWLRLSSRRRAATICSTSPIRRRAIAGWRSTIRAASRSSRTALPATAFVFDGLSGARAASSAVFAPSDPQVPLGPRELAYQWSAGHGSARRLDHADALRRSGDHASCGTGCRRTAAAAPAGSACGVE